MRVLKVFFIIASTIFYLSACQRTDPTPVISHGPIIPKDDFDQTKVDCGLNNKVELNSNELSDEFFASKINNGYSPIVIHFPTSYDKEYAPEMLDNWLWQLRDRGGIIAYVELDGEEAFELGDIFNYFLKALIDYVRDEIKYRNIDKYNAIVYVKNGTKIISRIAFVCKPAD